jgi:hypothetical protein
LTLALWRASENADDKWKDGIPDRVPTEGCLDPPLSLIDWQPRV